MSSVAAVIVNWNSGGLLEACLASVHQAGNLAEILVIDNASDDGSTRCLGRFGGRMLLLRNPVNRGFAAAVNQGFEATSSSYVLLLNPDVQVLRGSAERLQHFLDAHPRAGAVGGYAGEKYLPKRSSTVWSLIRENLGVPQARVYAPETLNGRTALEADQPAAAALMIRRDAYRDAGPFDERFYPAWYEDVDFCRRLKMKGWQIYFAPGAEFLHRGGYSAERLGLAKFLRMYYSNQLRYARKHFGPAGAAAVRASIAAGMVGRMVSRPFQVRAYAETFIAALRQW
jgi:GT2 family glycosyltransferase